MKFIISKRVPNNASIRFQRFNMFQARKLSLPFWWNRQSTLLAINYKTDVVVWGKLSTLNMN